MFELRYRLNYTSAIYLASVTFTSDIDVWCAYCPVLEHALCSDGMMYGNKLLITYVCMCVLLHNSSTS